MKVSVDRLRWAVAGAVLLLLGGILAFVSYGHYAAARKWHEILARSGVRITQESDNITWSQTVQGRTLYTIRAKKAIPLEGNRYTLHGVTILLYSKDGKSVDRLDGDEFQYDKDAGVAKAIGAVHMDIQAPGALAGTRQGEHTEAPGSDGGKNVIHVLTSGLVYVQKLGVAATDQQVDFRYAGIDCVSRGAEFDTGDSALHLLADIVLTAQLRGEPMVLHASRADLDRQKNTISLVQPVASSPRQKARAGNALLWLRPDGSLDHADATGAVLLEDATRHVAAGRMQASFGAQNLPQRALLSGGVTLEGNAAKPMHGTAQQADLLFTSGGGMNVLSAKGAVRLLSSGPNASGKPLEREIRGEEVVAHFQPAAKGKESRLREVHAVGTAVVRSEALAAPKPASNGVPSSRVGIVTTTLAADDLLGRFDGAAGPKQQPLLQRVSGHGNTRLEQQGMDGAEQVSTADAIEITLASGGRAGVAHAANGAETPLRVQAAVQTGHVQIRDQAAAIATAKGSRAGPLSLAHADRAEFDNASSRVTLSGSAGYGQGGTSLSAQTIRLEQGSGNAEAEGGVETSLAGADRDATHVLADRAELMHGTQTASFFGSDAHPARLWQGSSQVTAANLYLDQAHEGLSARPASAAGSVEAIFTSAARPHHPPNAGQPGRQPGASTGEPVHVSAPALNYSGVRHEAVCTGGVRVRDGAMQVRAQQAVVFLAGAKEPVAQHGSGVAAPVGGPAELRGSVERMVFSGSVRLQAPGRTGDGEQLVYTAADGDYVLTGSAARPPRVADVEQGMVTGPALLFRSGEKSVVVTGSAASNGHEPGNGRVHTEVTVRPQER